MIIDLHGLTVQEGWRLFNQSVTSCFRRGDKSLLVITGNGRMSSEIITWCKLNTHVSECRRQQYGRGAWTIAIKRNRKIAKSMPRTNILEVYKYLNG